MSKILKNTTASAVNVNDVGVEINASANYTIPPNDYAIWSSSVNVDSLISAGTLVVNDGYDDLKPDAGVRHIHEESMPRSSAFVAAAVVQAVANSTLTLTSTSRLLYMFTGTTAGQIVKLPSATTLNVGYKFEFWNNSTQQIVIQDGAGTGLFILAVAQKTWATLQANTTTAGTWLFEANFQGGTGGGNGCLNFGYNGTANSGRWYEVISNNPTTPGTGTPFVVAGPKAIRALSISVDTASTSTILLFKNGAFLDFISLASAKKASKLNLNHILLDLDELAVQLFSGTQSRPNVTLWL